MSVSEGLHVRLPTLYHSETEPISYSPVTQPTTPICPSDSNWANKYDDFDIGNPIGYGSSAVVYEAIYKPLKKRVAIKMIDLDMFERNQIDELRRETALMALSKHPNVLRVYGSFVNGSKLYIVTPYLAAGSCLDIMKSSFPDGFDEISIATILRQALEGLIYLHKNGHIHRDVKAGNLLMDQQGTVLLADFGVSSSLAENGDVRKTFVGTPCWMAPEVMEQAGYDYKADIWSFGITALELATGHAPFAKFPPMKVLMMTLSNAPPTLDRENAKHKFSKYFKEMIDLCLQKEPNKRPSAEKLIIHPFFKQAKKRDYLVKSVLANVLPLDKRPHRKIPHKKIAFQTTEQWDFDDTQTENQPIDTKPILTATPQDTPSLDRSKSTVQFDECPKPNLVKTSSIHASPIDTIDTPKKHISFGEAVIKDPSSSSSRSVMSPVVESPSPILSEPAGVAVSYPPPTLSSAPLSKKSRFVIQDSAPSSAHSSHISPAAAVELHTPPMSATELSHTGVGLGICTSPTNTVITNMNTVSTINNSTPSSAAAAAAAVGGGLQEGEFKKGRFSVNQTPTRPATPVEDLPANDLYRTTPMSRATSQDSFQERKSRFEVKQKSNHGQDPATPLQSFPLTRENSNVSTREGTVSNKVSRFSIEKPDGTSTPATPASTAALSPECRKKGRFELTGGNDSSKEFINMLESPQSTVAPSPVISPCNSISRGQAHRILDPSMPNMVYSHMENLLKQTEIQKNMLHDLLATMPIMYTNPTNASRSRTISDSKKPSSIPPCEDFYQR
ncbi:kinase-like domain-containing protein [Mucor mucedo]|uniref:kinase-like domain-containing protein n=1 Tax=Mucor mucedo TaxID=29922 RepID=UPI002220C6F0|nr:kinase-like domain-containing protein [Mucor mucedo]KAI7889620.1 kinase-like domain-containing protein [Mucor mucedo]